MSKPITAIKYRISKALTIRNMTQQELADSTGIPKSSISQYISGYAKPKDDRIHLMAKALRVQEPWLLGYDVSMDSQERTEQSPTTKPKAIKIPVLGMVHAGYPVDAIEDVLDWEEVTPEMSARGDLMALQVKGDCMEPRFAEGDVVIVLCQNTAKSGDIVIVMVNHDEAEMKKLKRFENGCINLVPLNAAYPVKSFSPQEIEELPIRILGKVIELRAKF